MHIIVYVCIAELLGFADHIPPFATASGNAILNGVNYASGGAGILNGTGKQFVIRKPVFICFNI